MATELIIALDVDTLDAATHAVDTCGGCIWYKAGLQLFSRTGPAIIEQLKAANKKVFLDLKLHDIPNTVKHAAQAAAGMGADLITIHACGGAKMIAAAREAVEGSQTRVLAVTVLTSINDAVLQNEVGIPASAEETVTRFAKLAVNNGAHGVVASPHEIAAIRSAVGHGPLIVTPGIRPAWASTDDQARFMTPREAALAGANFVVVGRPILKHANPTEAVALVTKELAV
ncbi:MAG: orotidine-5'-phosphate decarboxylase [Candidatus Hydrogenedentes bacterium]|nr:orotidine-5'-phosphate decarboxylase [Candidatus Hydrogenedentota bacterium]